jgi:hypothetical protein
VPFSASASALPEAACANVRNHTAPRSACKTKHRPQQNLRLTRFPTSGNLQRERKPRQHRISIRHIQGTHTRSSSMRTSAISHLQRGLRSHSACDERRHVVRRAEQQHCAQCEHRIRHTRKRRPCGPLTICDQKTKASGTKQDRTLAQTTMGTIQQR